MSTLMLLPDREDTWLFGDSTEILWGDWEEMPYTLFDLTYRVARELAITMEGIATGGNASTLVDTNDRTEQADYWNGGTVWILRDAAGLAGAPEGQFARISDFGSNTVTFRDALSAGVAANDRYAIANNRIPLDTIIQQINAALLDPALGPVPYNDDTSLVTADDTTEYSLPIDASHSLRQVWLQTRDDNIDDNRWIEVKNWEIQLGDPGNVSTLIFPYPQAENYKVRLVYNTLHPSLYTYSDPLMECVPSDLVIYPAVLGCYRWLKGRTGWNKWDDDIRTWERKVKDARENSHVKMAAKPSRIIMIQERPYYDEVGDVNKVNLS